MMPPRQYVEDRDGVYRIAGTRISLDSVVHGFLNGESPETITQNFESLTLVQVYGAILFYLSNQEEVDAYLVRQDAEFDRLRRESRAKDPMFYVKWAERKRQLTPR